MGQALKLLETMVLGVLLGISSSAHAQIAAPPPVRQSIDGNGIDLFLGTMNIDAPALTLGQGELQGLAYYKLIRGSGWADNLNGTINQVGSTITVTLGGISDSFTVSFSGTTFTPTQGNGATLTLNVVPTGPVYLYTRADGTASSFNGNFASPLPFYANKGRIEAISPAAGGNLLLTYENVTYCTQPNPGHNPPCSQHAQAHRVISAQNSVGYKMSFTYPSVSINPDAPYDVAALTSWSTPTGAAASNLAGSGTPLVSQTYSSSTSGGTTTALVTDALSRTSQYRLDIDGKLLGLKRPGSSSEDLTIAYASGKVSGITTLAGTTGYAYADASGVRTTTVTDPLMHVWTYTFDIASQRMLSMTDPLNRTTSWRYDADGRVEYIVQPEGHTTPESNYTKFTYDLRGNIMGALIVPKLGSGLSNIVTSAFFPASCATTGTVNYKTCNKPYTTTDENGRVTDYTYDLASGEVATATLPAPAVGAIRPQTRYSYTFLQGIYRLTGTSTCQTTISCVGTVDEAVTTITYNNNALPITQSAGAGNGTLTATESYTYDEVGNQLTVDGPLTGTADITRTRYDAARQVVGVVGPNPSPVGYTLKFGATKFTYDSKGRITLTEQGTVNSQSDADWALFLALQAVATTYNGVDQKLTDTLSAKGITYGVTQYTYDAASRLDCAAVRLSWSSLPPSACTNTPGANVPDRITRQFYDSANQVTSVQTGYDTTLARIEVATTYSGNGQVTTVKDSRNDLTTYEYDGFDRLKSTCFPLPSTPGSSSPTDCIKTTLFDNNGNPRIIVQRDGQTINLTYDFINRLTFKDLPGAEPDVSYTYDLLGRITNLSQPNNALSFTYDALNRNLTQTGPQGTLTYQYDLAGRRTRMTWPDNFYATYDYLLTGQVSTIRENGAPSGVGVLGTYYYDNLGRRTALTRGNGTTTSYGYDDISRMTDLTQNLTGTAADQTVGLSYTNAGQIAMRSVSNDTYAPTNLYNADRSYTVNGLNQYSQAGTSALTYDTRGNLTGIGAKSYGYSSENYLTSGPSGFTLAYDPVGRLYQTLGATTARLAYDGLNLAAEYNASDAIQRRYVYGPGDDEPLVRYEGGGTTDRRWLHADERGSVIAVSDGLGSSVALNSYDDWGNPAATNEGRFGYTGQTWIAELSMYYYKARFYEPRLGRFMQTDPIGYDDGMNLYAYVGNDPVNLVDVEGLQEDIIVTGGRIVKAGGGSSPRGGGGVPGRLEKARDKSADARSEGILVRARRRVARALNTFAERYLKPPEGRQDGESYIDCVQRIAGDGSAAAGGSAAVVAGANVVPYPRAVPPGGSGTSLISTISRKIFSGLPRMGSFKVAGTNSVGGAVGRVASRGSVFAGAAAIGLTVGKAAGAAQVCAR